MNRQQIGLKVAMDILGITVEMKRYREICDAVYHMQKGGGGCDLGYRILLDSRGRSYSPMSHESSGMLGHNLATDVQDIELDLKQGFEFELEGRSLDDKSRRFLTRLRDDIKDGKIKLRKKWEDKD